MLFIGGINTHLRILKPKNNLKWQKYNNRNFSFNLLNETDNSYFFETKKLFVAVNGDIFSKFFSLNKFFIQENRDTIEKKIRECEGIFSLIIFDKINSEVTIINDKLGLFPIYIWNRGDSLIFSSHLGLILIQSRFSLNADGVHEFFSYGCTFNENTLVNGIINLKPGSVFKFRNGNISSKNYYRLSFESEEKTSLEDLVEDLRDSILLLCPQKKCQMDLSGGFDTRLILGILLMNKREIYTYTHYNFSKLEFDYLCAKKIGELYNLKQRFRRNESMRFLSMRSSFFLDYFLRTQSSKKTLNKPKLTGFFGSDLFRGINKREMKDKNLIPEKYLSKSLIYELSIDPAKELKQLYGEINVKKHNEYNTLYLTQFLRSDMVAQTGLFFRTRDRFLKNGLYPFLNTNFIRTVFTFPADSFSDDEMYLKLLMKIKPSLLNIPWESRENRVKYKGKYKIPNNAKGSHLTDVEYENLLLERELRHIANIPFLKNIEFLKKRRPRNMVYFNRWYQMFRNNILI